MKEPNTKPRVWEKPPPPRTPDPRPFSEILAENDRRDEEYRIKKGWPDPMKAKPRILVAQAP